MDSLDKIRVDGVDYTFHSATADRATSATSAATATSATSAQKVIVANQNEVVMSSGGTDNITYAQIKQAIQGGGGGGGDSDTALQVKPTAASWIDEAGVKHTIAPVEDQTASVLKGIWGTTGITETYKGKQVSNLSVMASKNLNLESGKNIQMKSAGGTVLHDVGKLLLAGGQLSLGVDGNKYFATSNASAVTGASEYSIEYAFDDLGDITLDTDASTDTAVSFKAGAKTKDKAPKNSEFNWSYAKFKARAFDFRCHTHGGIALQPAGADSDNHINKIKFEHSLCVPIEHFQEYTVAQGTSYSYATESTWHRLGQLSLIAGDGACQVCDQKILKSGFSAYNDGLVDIDAQQGVKGFVLADVKYQLGISDSVDGTPGAFPTTAADCNGKFLWARRYATSGLSVATLPAVMVAQGTGSDCNKFNTIDGGTNPITVAASATGEAIIGQPALKRVALNGTEEEQFTVSNGHVNIDGVDYNFTATALTKTYKTDASTLPTGSKGSVVTERTVSFPIAGNKVAITPCYPIHFAQAGGDGVEFGTFNPLVTSIYSKEYRLNANATLCGITREWDATAHGGAGDYKTQADDTKDLPADGDRVLTVGTIFDLLNLVNTKYDKISAL